MQCSFRILVWQFRISTTRLLPINCYSCGDGRGHIITLKWDFFLFLLMLCNRIWMKQLKNRTTARYPSRTRFNSLKDRDKQGRTWNRAFWELRGGAQKAREKPGNGRAKTGGAEWHMTNWQPANSFLLTSLFSRKSIQVSWYPNNSIKQSSTNHKS